MAKSIAMNPQSTLHPVCVLPFRIVHNELGCIAGIRVDASHSPMPTLRWIIPDTKGHQLVALNIITTSFDRPVSLTLALSSLIHAMNQASLSPRSLRARPILLRTGLVKAHIDAVAGPQAASFTYEKAMYAARGLGYWCALNGRSRETFAYVELAVPVGPYVAVGTVSFVNLAPADHLTVESS